MTPSTFGHLNCFRAGQLARQAGANRGRSCSIRQIGQPAERRRVACRSAASFASRRRWRVEVIKSGSSIDWRSSSTAIVSLATSVLSIFHSRSASSSAVVVRSSSDAARRAPSGSPASHESNSATVMDSNSRLRPRRSSGSSVRPTGANRNIRGTRSAMAMFRSCTTSTDAFRPDVRRPACPQFIWDAARNWAAGVGGRSTSTSLSSPTSSRVGQAVIATDIDSDVRTATIVYHGYNETSLASALRTGSDQLYTNLQSNAPKTGPFSTISQEFYWTEEVHW
ncbi:hypothetical protein BH11ACT5_BH11ACT5_14100 [soil metagenome]